VKELGNVVCGKCHDRGIYVKDGMAYRCRCMEEHAKKKRYMESRLTKKMLQQTFETFDFSYYPEDAYHQKNGKSYYEIARSTFQAAVAFAELNLQNKESKGLFIYGNVGSGKTFLCSAIANHLLYHGQRVLFLVVPDLLDEIRASYSGESDMTEIQVLRTARNSPVLILDDLGAHNYTEWARNKIYSIVNNRLNNGAPTVINSNLNLGEIEEFLGERTTSRIVELCDIHGLYVPTDIRHVKNLQRR